ITRRRARLVELDKLEPPGDELGERDARPVVGALRECDRRPGGAEREHAGRDRGRSGSVQERLAALERAEGVLGRRARRMRVPLVDELAGLAVLVVRPGRRAVDAHAGVKSVSCIPSGATRRTLTSCHGVSTGPPMRSAPAASSAAAAWRESPTSNAMRTRPATRRPTSIASTIA